MMLFTNIVESDDVYRCTGKADDTLCGGSGADSYDGNDDGVSSVENSKSSWFCFVQSL